MSEGNQPMVPEPSGALLGEVNRDLHALARRRRWTLIGISVLALFSVGIFAAYRSSAAGATAPGLGQPLHVTVLIAFVALALVFYALALGVWFPTRRQLRLWGAAGVVGWLGLLVTTSIGYEQLSAAQPGHVCLAEGSVVGISVGVAALFFGGRLLRQRAPTGGLIGLAAGTLSLAPLHVVCIDASMGHLLFWHGATPVLCALVVTAGWILLRSED